ncbi:MAG: hypothetical protein M0P26_01015 [Bacteroidales bacterium]|nr:hypothetical protein [Bacteroidales bacterium]
MKVFSFLFSYYSSYASFSASSVDTSTKLIPHEANSSERATIAASLSGAL